MKNLNPATLSYVIYITRSSCEAELILNGLRAEYAEFIHSGYGPCRMDTIGFIPKIYEDHFYCYIASEATERPEIILTSIV